MVAAGSDAGRVQADAASVDKVAGEGEGLTRLDKLPNDILVHLLKSCHFKTVSTLARTCRRMRAMCARDDVWVQLFKGNGWVESEVHEPLPSPGDDEGGRAGPQGKGKWRDLFSHRYSLERRKQTLAAVECGICSAAFRGRLRMLNRCRGCSIAFCAPCRKEEGCEHCSTLMCPACCPDPANVCSQCNASVCGRCASLTCYDCSKTICYECRGRRPPTPGDDWKRCVSCEQWVCMGCLQSCEHCQGAVCSLHASEFEGLRCCWGCLRTAKRTARDDRIRSSCATSLSQTLPCGGTRALAVERPWSASRRPGSARGGGVGVGRKGRPPSGLRRSEPAGPSAPGGPPTVRARPSAGLRRSEPALRPDSQSTSPPPRDAEEGPSPPPPAGRESDGDGEAKVVGGGAAIRLRTSSGRRLVESPSPSSSLEGGVALTAGGRGGVRGGGEEGDGWVATGPTPPATPPGSPPPRNPGI